MTTTGTEQVAAIFRELEAESGEDVVQAIMDAQRSYIRTAMDKAEMEQGYPYLRRFPAFRGMGNLTQHDLRSEGLEAVVENSSPAPMVGGILRGVFELLSDGESRCDYRRGGGRKPGGYGQGALTAPVTIRGEGTGALATFLPGRDATGPRTPKKLLGDGGYGPIQVYISTGPGLVFGNLGGYQNSSSEG